MPHGVEIYAPKAIFTVRFRYIVVLCFVRNQYAVFLGYWTVKKSWIWCKKKVMTKSSFNKIIDRNIIWFSSFWYVSPISAESCNMNLTLASYHSEPDKTSYYIQSGWYFTISGMKKTRQLINFILTMQNTVLKGCFCFLIKHFDISDKLVSS